MDSYTDFAQVYDVLMSDTPYAEWAGWIEGLIRQYGVSKPSWSFSSAAGSRGGGERCEGEAFSPEGKAFSPEDEAFSPEGEAFSLEDEALSPREKALMAERDLVVDLGCGTGTLTELLSAAGYDMVGIDSSQDMLNAAMDKKARTGSEILYLRQDMRELELYGTAGTFVSVCDSLNYLLEEEDLLTVFRLVNNYLYPDGIFIFDFNTVYKYEKIIGDSTIAENRENCSFIWENIYHAGEEINEYDLTFFVREGNGDLFRRFTETHFQRGYTAGRMRRLVEEAGLRWVTAMDADTHGEVTPESERIYVVAREHGKKRFFSDGRRS